MSKYHKYTLCPICECEITVQSLNAHVAKHNKTPKNSCIQCQKATYNPHFCSHSCRAQFINPRRPKKIRVPKETTQERHARFYREGRLISRPALRKQLAAERGYNCEICDTFEWQGKPITLIVDHEDGNAGNNAPENLRLLCPNCNSQTDTFGGRNKGSGRKARGLPLN